MIATQLFSLGCILGEGAMWHASRRSFFWVDIEQKRFYECRWDTRQLITYEVGRRVSLILETASPDAVLLAVQGGLVNYDLNQQRHEWVTEIERYKPGNRTNDGACDAMGRIWVGTMNLHFKEGEGALYRLSPGGAALQVVDNLTIPNGIAWSNDGRMMYHVETHERVVRAYKYDADSGKIEFSHVAIQVPPGLGLPDGMAMDEEGMLWIAHWNGYGVYRWNPANGKLISKIEVPAPQVTSCAFGGDDMRTMLITTAREGLTDEQIQKYPLSGDVFMATPGYRGVERNVVEI